MMTYRLGGLLSATQARRLRAIAVKNPEVDWIDRLIEAVRDMNR